MKKFLLLIFFAPFLALGTVSPDNHGVQSGEVDPPDQEAFPITVDFHCPRSFGFHIGDEIPLTVTVEASEGPIVDLVNLPRKGEIHGSFEVRSMRVRKRQKDGRTVYTVLYQLQSFEPAIAVDKVKFPPLRICYATKGDWNPAESRYHYRSLYSQGFDIFVSRTATYFGPMKDIKGPIVDERVAVIWKATSGVGGLMVLAALICWPWEYIRRRRRVECQSPIPTARDRALKALGEARERCFNYKDHRKHLFFEINAILRHFLKDFYGLNTANRPSIEIVNQLKDRPFYEELKGFVERVNQVIYEGDAPADVEPIMRQFNELLEGIDGTMHQGTNHDKAG
ncbi:MAG: hypothetical protein JSW70_00625 [Syntrophobacterales bacterium]|nr:MAG: hypothetical protein JSW70_00625 [Syntrophobacterales bacterium]